MQILGGRYHHFKLQSPSSTYVRPTSSQLRAAVFNICQNSIEGATFLDLFAGSGAMGLEALSRGASHATLVEQDRNAIACIRQNIAKMQLEAQATILQGDVFSHVLRLSKKNQIFDFIYIDPPYDQLATWQGKRIPFSHKTLYLIDQTELISKDGSLFVETSKAENPQHVALKKLQLKECRRYGTTILSEFQLKGVK